MSKSLTKEQIENFLKGNDPQQYIVAVEGDYSSQEITLVINDPEKGKSLENHKYKPFVWFKEEINSILYGGKKTDILEAKKRFNVEIKLLRTTSDTGYEPIRMKNGYKYIAKCNGNYLNLISFFKNGGVDIFDKEISKYFIAFSPVEQFLIQTGKRLFKGFEDYNDLHKFQFDLETEGLTASRNAIFQIGLRDNRGIEYVLETEGDTQQEKRNSERENIEKFFKIIDILKPDIISGYNSENFDWGFLFERAERLNVPISELAITLNRASKIKRKESTLKLGSETEHYKQTHMYGYNVLDISHAVRRAMAINSEIKSWGLKYITQYCEIEKPNRVYIQGDKINTIWADKTNSYAFNNVDGDWYKITDKTPLKEGYEIVTGAYIVHRYLCDDLWETEQIDNIYNQASFLISKMLPTTFMRSSTMGTAGQWKLIMSAWSYEQGLAIPETQKKEKFTGGLSRLLEVGYAKNVVKLDYAALYPKTELTHNIFPDLDITGVMKGILTYVVDTRDKFKFLTGKEKGLAKKLQKKLDSEDLTTEKVSEIKKEISNHKSLSSIYDKKQLPLKILANSWFGAYGAPYIFNWGDIDCAEETTCRGRQYLRLMVRHFCEKYGFRALVGDSVTYDTPVYIRYANGDIDVKPICDLFNETSDFIDSEKLRDFEEKPYDVLTVNGWKKIKYVFRHGTDKEIHRVTTKDRLVQVTEDHSLFQNKKQIKPSTLKRGDKIDVYNEDILKNNYDHITLNQAWLMGFFLGDGSSVYGPRKQYYKSKKTGSVNINKGTRGDWKISNTNLKYLEKLKDIVEREFFTKAEIKNHLKSSGVYNLVVNNSAFAKRFSEDFYTSYREKKIPISIFNSNKEIKKAFLNGVFASDGYGDDLENVSDIGMKSQVAMAGLSIIFKSLNIDYKIRTRKDKQNFISFKLKNRNRKNSSFTDKTIMKSDEVWKNETILNTDKNKFVYDISTDDGTFIGGIGMINLKNTDGFNFAFPDNIDEIKYVAKGSHWKTEDDAGKELIGLDAVLAEFNENYMIGRMGLDIDDICDSTINFSRKNYANKINGKIKLVGNSIKSKKMSAFIEDFLKVAIEMLLDGDGYSFVKHYHDYVDKIYNYQIPLVKIASKSKVKSTIEDYKKKASKKNKAGNPMPKQAHMELVIKENIKVNLGDTLFYVNIGKTKTDGDLKTYVKSKMKKRELEKYIETYGEPPKSEITVQLNSKLIDPLVVERDFESIKELEVLKKLLSNIDENDPQRNETLKRIDELNSSLYTDEYNVAKYLNSFNKKVKPLLVCFHPDIRDKILLDIKKVKDENGKKSIEKLQEKTFFTKSECDLVSGMPFKAIDQDSYEELMTMEDKEIKFWSRVKKIPNNMEPETWRNIELDYYDRMEKVKTEELDEERKKLDDIFKRLEVSELNDILYDENFPDSIMLIASRMSDEGYLISRKWDENICHISDVFKYENIAKSRHEYYESNNLHNDKKKYEKWFEYVCEHKLMTNEDLLSNIESETNISVDTIATSFNKKSNEITSNTEKNIVQDLDNDEEESNDEDDEESDETYSDDIILEDEYDDTFSERPDVEIPIDPYQYEEDEWPF